MPNSVNTWITFVTYVLVTFVANYGADGNISFDQSNVMSSESMDSLLTRASQDIVTATLVKTRRDGVVPADVETNVRNRMLTRFLTSRQVLCQVLGRTLAKCPGATPTNNELYSIPIRDLIFDALGQVKQICHETSLRDVASKPQAVHCADVIVASSSCMLGLVSSPYAPQLERIYLHVLHTLVMVLRMDSTLAVVDRASLVSMLRTSPSMLLCLDLSLKRLWTPTEDEQRNTLARLVGYLAPFDCTLQFNVRTGILTVILDLVRETSTKDRSPILLNHVARRLFPTSSPTHVAVVETSKAVSELYSGRPYALNQSRVILSAPVFAAPAAPPRKQTRVPTAAAADDRSSTREAAKVLSGLFAPSAKTSSTEEVAELAHSTLALAKKAIDSTPSKLAAFLEASSRKRSSNDQNCSIDAPVDKKQRV